MEYTISFEEYEISYDSLVQPYVGEFETEEKDEVFYIKKELIKWQEVIDVLTAIKSHAPQDVAARYKNFDKIILAQEIVEVDRRRSLKGDAGAIIKFLQGKLPEQSTRSEKNVSVELILPENNVDHINMKIVYQHFYSGLVSKKHLTDEELKEYLRMAFNLQIKPLNKLSLKNISGKNKIIQVFHDYYKDVVGKPHGKQKDYAALLGDYFSGFETDNVSSNFARLAKRIR
jgi:hypothetical protein